MKRVLVDTSVWVQHFREGNPHLIQLLELDLVLIHPLVVGEIACGTPPQRQQTLHDLGLLPLTQQATLQETLAFVEQEHLFGQGCGLIDHLLLASTLITPGCELWTRDKRLSALAERFGAKHFSIQH